MGNPQLTPQPPGGCGTAGGGSSGQIVFAGAARPRGPYHVTMDTNDAIETAHAFSSSSIIAVHNDGWAHFTETQNDIVQAFSSLGLAARLQTLQAGRPERLVLG